MNIICLDTIDSTSEEAKRRLRAAASFDEAKTLFGTAITARTQTAGKGRRGRSFHSPDTGDSLYISFILPQPTRPQSLQLFTVAAAVAVCFSIEEILADSDDTMQHPAIKWVNDVLIDNRKICGILAESVAQSGADGQASSLEARHEEDRADPRKGEPEPYCGIVLGIGVNINMSADDFPEELRGIAGSLQLQEDKVEIFTEILCKNVHGIYKDMENGQAGAVLDLYRKFENTTGREVIIMKHAGGGSGLTAGVKKSFADTPPTGTGRMPQGTPDGLTLWLGPRRDEDIAPYAQDDTGCAKKDTGYAQNDTPYAQRNAETILLAEEREVTAYAKAIADDGGLVVVHNDGTEEILRSGEISVRGTAKKDD